MKKLNLGCGKDYRQGFVNIDAAKPCDLIHDLNEFPYPFKDNSVDFILASHILEHLKEPEKFFGEIWRILKPEGILKIKVPHKDSIGAYSTFGHRGFYHEIAIEAVTNPEDENNVFPKFKHIKTIVKRGRFLKWQKREIIWIIKK